MTFRKRGYWETERRRTSSLSLENSVWKRHWTRSTTDERQMMVTCAHSVLMCYVRFSQNTIMSVNRLNWLVFVTEMQCVYHEVTTKLPSFSRLVAILSAWWPGFDLKAVHVRFVVDKVALGQVSLPVLRFPPYTNLPSMLRIYLLFIRKNGWILGTSSKATLFRMSALDRK